MVNCAKLDPTYLNVARKRRVNEIPGTDEVDLTLSIVHSWLTRLDDSPIFGNFDSRIPNILADCGPTPGMQDKTLDLISHSVGDYLQIGPWTINVSNASNPSPGFPPMMGATLNSLGITRIRLLGCTTALAQAGKDTVTNLQAALGGSIKVQGTDQLLYHTDFDKDGFINTHLKLWPDTQPAVSLAMAIKGPVPKPDVSIERDVPKFPDFPDDAPPVRDFDLERVPDYPSSALSRLPGVIWSRSILRDRLTARQAEAIYGHVGNGVPNGRSMPGLLAAPSREYWIPVHDNQFRLMQFLFGWRMLRVYSDELQMVEHVPRRSYAARYLITNPFESALYRVEKPDQLRDFMASLPGHVLAPPRRFRPPDTK